MICFVLGFYRNWVKLFIIFLIFCPLEFLAPGHVLKHRLDKKYEHNCTFLIIMFWTFWMHSSVSTFMLQESDCSLSIPSQSSKYCFTDIARHVLETMFCFGIIVSETLFVKKCTRIFIRMRAAWFHKHILSDDLSKEISNSFSACRKKIC